MRLSSRSLWLPKGGNRPDEYEDACRPVRSMRRPAHGFRCAVADGATEASFSGLWARLIVDAYSRGEIAADGLESRLEPLRDAWRGEVDSRPLPWYAEEKRRQGAFSSLLGLTILMAGDTCRWEALAIGDSCLFHVRAGNLLTAFPLATSDSFNERPHLLCSNGSANLDLQRHLQCARGECVAGDSLYLLTDALAQWFLREWEAGGDPAPTLDRFTGPRALASFSAWIADVRAAAEMRNDDVTMLRLYLE